MKIYTAQQIRNADAFTIKNEPISSIDLMERASNQVYKWLISKYSKQTKFSIFCGVGNNGGDGLAVARLLHQKGYSVQVFEVLFSKKTSVDYGINRKRLEGLKIPISILQAPKDIQELIENTTIIDAIFGSGLSREVDGWVGELITQLNLIKSTKISIDIASGLFSENNDANNGPIFKPHYTLSFQFQKLAFMFPENQIYVGKVKVLPIGISEEYILTETTGYFTLERFTAKLIHRKSNKFDYKNTYGHALMIGGSFGKMGAMILASHACLKSGAGLVSAHVPYLGNDILQNSLPEAMTLPDTDPKILTELKDLENYSAIGVGPGMGTRSKTQKLFYEILCSAKQPLVIDADALNILSENPDWINLLPNGSVLTPHLGELNRLLLTGKKPLERLKITKDFTKKNKVFVIIKGAHTSLVCPDGEVFFNTTGNPGMATAGSGDVLTGIITGLLSQGYEPKQAALLGVYIHGLAGDIGIKTESRESLLASNIVENLGKAFKKLK